MIATESRRATDTQPPSMRTVKIVVYSFVVLLAIFALSCLGSFAATQTHAVEIAQAQQVADANAAALKSVCTVLVARDTKLRELASEQTVIYATYKAALPKGFSAAMVALGEKRMDALSAIDSAGCNAPPPTPANTSTTTTTTTSTRP